MKRHRTDGVSLTFGVLFLAIVAWWLLAQIFHLALPAVGWSAAGALILLGIFGLIGALRANPTPDPAAPAPASHEAGDDPLDGDPTASEFDSGRGRPPGTGDPGAV